MDHVGKGRFSRRSFLAGSVAGAAGLVSGGILSGEPLQTASCGSLDRELTEGPYYLDRAILRKNITEGRPGIPLQLQLSVLDARTCKPLENPAVEIWHCDRAASIPGLRKWAPGVRDRAVFRRSPWDGVAREHRPMDISVQIIAWMHI